jgi:hypothetical protein
MGKMETIKQQTLELSDAEFTVLRDWLEEQAELRWDEQIARDERAGRLDAMSERAMANLAAGRVRDL